EGNLTPVPPGDVEPINWRARALPDEPTRAGGEPGLYEEEDERHDAVTRTGDPDETRSGIPDPNATRVGSGEAKERQRRKTDPPSVHTRETSPGLDFPEETKRAARGNKLLDLQSVDDLVAPTDDERTSATLEALRIDTDRMPTLTDEELAAEAAARAAED